MKLTPEHAADYIEFYSTRPQKVVPLPHHEQILRVAEDIGAKTVLDYGAGPPQALKHFATDLNVTSYDPVLGKGRDNTMMYKEPFDMVVCHHVLEHVQPECLEYVLADICRLTKKVAYIVVSLQASTKLLPSGKPWHQIVHEPWWWRQKYGRFFPNFLDLPSQDEREYGIVWTRPNA